MTHDEIYVIIVACNREMPIGYRGQGMTDAKSVYHQDQPFVCLRPATEEEWARSVKEHGGEPKRHPGDIYFYGISTD